MEKCVHNKNIDTPYLRQSLFLTLYPYTKSYHSFRRDSELGLWAKFENI